MQYVPPIGGGADDPYVDADPGAAIEGSAVPAGAIEDPMRELVALITDAGLAPSGASLTQVAAAVRTLIQKQAPSVSVAGGTADAITAAFTPAITTDTVGRIPTVTLTIVAAGANTGAGLTIDAGTGAFGVVKGAGAAIIAGDVAGAGFLAMVRGVRGVNAAADKWVLLNPAKGVATETVAAVQGVFRNLRGSAPGTSAIVTYTLDEVTTGDGAGGVMTTRGWNATITMTAAGAGGLDTGAVAASTWYYAFAITKDDGTKALMASLSATAPTMPAGYTKWARIGAFRTDGTANKYPLSFSQIGRRVQYKVAAGSNLVALPIMASGAAGNTATPTWVAVGVSNFVPPTAAAIDGSIAAPNVAAVVVIAAPNNAYGGYTSASNPVPVSINSQSPSLDTAAPFTFLLESSSVYWASSGAGAMVICRGWEDAL